MSPAVELTLMVLLVALVSAVGTALITIIWLKHSLPIMIKKACAQQANTAEKGLMARLSQTVGGERFYGKRFHND